MDTKMTITEQQRKHIIDLIVYEMNDNQSSDRYYFENELLSVLWIRDDESYVVLSADKTYDYYGPSDIVCVIEELQDDTLIEWLMENEGLDTKEEINEYFEDAEITE
jgi:hypothetical protein